ncbi:WhiB family transcriptional regulator [Corynebacterium pseudotuberculosis]|uniref:WhiB family transcriptional regulator n=1 Tax=Corynebacterium pseudotuberculosis TaxID=1719 RepID=UPI003AADD9C1
MTPRANGGLARRSRERQAKEICSLCPVLRNCRQHALQYAEPYGIWGGLSESERATMLSRRYG